MRAFRTGTLVVSLALLCSAAANAADTDGDGFDDAVDNCIDTPNGALESNQLDADADGYGNACDGDVNNDGMTGGPDISTVWACSVTAPGDPGPLHDPTCLKSDIDGNGVVDSADVNFVFAHFFQAPGPSGLACADATGASAPCFVADSTGDTDGDLVENFRDNCAVLQNYFAPPLLQRDNDHDGIGNACDGDFNNDGVVNSAVPGVETDRDVIDACLDQFVPGNGLDADPSCFESDMDASGYVDIDDLNLFLASEANGSSGPSGLDCADGSVSWPLLCGNVFSIYQQPDPDYYPTLAYSHYAPGLGPVVRVDSTHNNFQTIDDRYLPFDRLLTEDGYVASGFDEPFTPGCAADLPNCLYAAELLATDTLVIANARLDISPEEAQLLTDWVYGTLDTTVGCGGPCPRRRLLLIADHQSGNLNFPAHIFELSTRLGLDWPNNNTAQRSYSPTIPTDPNTEGLLDVNHPIAIGDPYLDEEVLSTTTFYGSALIGLTAPTIAGSVLTMPAGSVWIDEFEISQDATGWSQGIAFDFGSGRVYASGEAAMFTAQLVPRLEVYIEGNQWVPPGWVLFSAGNTLGMQTLGLSHNQQYLLNMMHWLDAP